MIGADLHTYVMARLNQWVVYCLWRADLLTASPGPKSVKSWWFSMITARNMRVPASSVPRPRCPVDELESGAMQVCVEQLPEKLRTAIVVGYLGGGTAEEKARELGCDRATYFRRMNRAYAELLGLMNDYEAGMLRVDVERANVELDQARMGAVSDEARVHAGQRVPPLKRGIAKERA